MTAGAILGDAWKVYRLLLKRSITTAALVYALIEGFGAASDTTHRAAIHIPLRVVSELLYWGGPVIVQGALVEIIRNVHEGRPPERIGSLLETGRRRFWSLFAAALLYTVGILAGLVALVVPGILVFARWSLMAPAVVLEGHGPIDAAGRSWRLVKGSTGPVLGALLFSLVVLSVPAWATFLFLPGGTHHLWQFGWAALTAPFDAHVLSVAYYRLVDPERPVIHEDVGRWRSVWAGA